MLRPICVIGTLRRTPPGFRGFPGGVTHIDIFKTTDPIDLKIFLGKLQHICSSEKFFRDPQNILAP